VFAAWYINAYGQFEKKFPFRGSAAVRNFYTSLIIPDQGILLISKRQEGKHFCFG
jgi:hypothetical protein